MHKTFFAFLMGGLIGSLAIMVPAAAQDAAHRKLHDRFYVDIGGFWPSVSTELRVDGPAGQNRSFSLEDDLHYSDNPTLPFALVNLRLGQRWRVEGEAFQIGRDNSTVLNRDITVRDKTFPVNSTVSSHFDTTVYRLSLGYSFLKRPDTEVGAALGLHVTDFDLGIQTSTGSVAAAADATAPLPTVGLYGYHALSPNWLIFGRADLFSLNYEQYSGGLVNLNLGVEYQVNKWLGLGGGWRYVKLDLDAEAQGSDWAGTFKHTYSGPMLYLSLGF